MIDYIDQIPSTTTHLLQRLGAGEQLSDLYTLCTFRQTAGRGQRGNGWESEPDKNISFTTVFDTSAWQPSTLPLLSMLVPLAVAEALEPLLQQSVSVKWPNDLYVGDKKIAGILIENVLQGGTIRCSIAGVGVNINQEIFLSGAPNPSSLKLLTGKTFNLHEVMQLVYDRLASRWQNLKPVETAHGASRPFELVRKDYLARLYRRQGMWRWREVEVTGAPIMPDMSGASDNTFEARIVDVDAEGRLVLERACGARRAYFFKEIKYII